MIQLNHKILSELEGCSSFGSKMENDVATERHVFGTPDEKEKQKLAVSKIQIVAERLEDVPCEASFEVKCKEGKVTLQGEINAYEQKGFNSCQAVMEEVRSLSYAFSRQYPESSFSITYSQSTTITRIDRAPLN